MYTNYRPMIQKSVAWVVLTVALVAVVVAAQWHRVSSSSAVEELQSLGYFAFDTPRTFEDVTLTDGSGEAHGLHDALDGWRFVFFGFTRCPDVCPTTLSVLNLAVSPMADPPGVILVSVDPTFDTPERVSTYARAFNRGFVGLTGDEAEIRRLADQLGIDFVKVESESDGYTVEHTGAIVVLDPSGRHAGYIRPPLNPENIRKIAAALIEGE